LKCAITNINCRQSNLLNIIHFINKLSNSYVHRIDIRINFMMINKDFRLLWRESSLFLSFLLKINIIKSSNNSIYHKLLSSSLYNDIKHIRKLKYLDLIQKWNIPLQVVLSYNNFISNQNKKKDHSQPNYFKKTLTTIANFQIKTLQSDKKISIIRSPFVYSKSKESFGLYNYALLISLKNLPNIFTLLYPLKIQCYYNKYNLPLSIKSLK